MISELNYVTAIHKLIMRLSEANPKVSCHERLLFDGAQIIIEKDKERIADIILHGGSYGHEDEEFEMMLLCDPPCDMDVHTAEMLDRLGVIGWLSEDEAVKLVSLL